MSRDKVRILHTSDVHIGAFTERWSPQPRKCLHAFKIVVDRALEEKVDAVLIAGDFFDHNRIKAEVADYVMEQLERLPMPTVILPGNHDPLELNSVYWRMDLEGRTPNVYLIKEPKGETVTYPELGFAVWGKPHVSYDDVGTVPAQGAAAAGAGAVADRHRTRPLCARSGGRGAVISHLSEGDCGLRSRLRGSWPLGRAHEHQRGQCGGVLPGLADVGGAIVDRGVFGP